MRKLILFLAPLIMLDMVLNAQTWIPDTCNCVIEQDKNGNFVQFIKKCDAYAALDDQTAYQAILNENKFKNQTYDYIMKTFPDTVVESDPTCVQAQALYQKTIDAQKIISSLGQDPGLPPDPPTCKSAPIIRGFDFSYDKTRKLQVVVPDLKPAEITALEQAKGITATTAPIIDVAPGDIIPK